eukprot:evm.model.scf_2369.2 EVM.evm.TU.scf_2369.2   scf_2369:17134-17568(-)
MEPMLSGVESGELETAMPEKSPFYRVSFSGGPLRNAGRSGRGHSRSMTPENLDDGQIFELDDIEDGGLLDYERRGRGCGACGDWISRAMEFCGSIMPLGEWWSGLSRRQRRGVVCLLVMAVVALPVTIVALIVTAEKGGKDGGG